MMKKLVIILFAPLLATGCPDNKPNAETPAASAEPPKTSTGSDKAGAAEPSNEKKDDKPGGGW